MFRKILCAVCTVLMLLSFAACENPSVKKLSDEDKERIARETKAHLEDDLDGGLYDNYIIEDPVWSDNEILYNYEASEKGTYFGNVIKSYIIYEIDGTEWKMVSRGDSKITGQVFYESDDYYYYVIGNDIGEMFRMTEMSHSSITLDIAGHNSDSDKFYTKKEERRLDYDGELGCFEFSYLDMVGTEFRIYKNHVEMAEEKYGKTKFNKVAPRDPDSIWWFDMAQNG